MTIPDVLVFSSFGSKMLKVSPLTGFDSAVVAEVIRHPGITQAIVAEELFARPETLASSLARLERLRVIRRAVNGRLYCYRGAVPFARLEVIAIEAKLWRWRKAVEQANSYREFADASYVALPARAIRSDIIGQCRSTGVGLISVAEKGQIDEFVSPRRSRPLSSLRVWLALRALANVPEARRRLVD
jgi:hypothetical protein